MFFGIGDVGFFFFVGIMSSRVVFIDSNEDFIKIFVLFERFIVDFVFVEKVGKI